MSKQLILAAVMAVLLFPGGIRAQEGSRCRSECGPALRACLQSGRPGLMACRSKCRSLCQQHQAGCQACGAEDCEEGADFQACVAACRETRRGEIRSCIHDSTNCSLRCRTPGPTPTPTPK